MFSNAIARWVAHAAAGAALAVLATAVAADQRERNGLAFNEVIKEANRLHWRNARTHADRVSDPVAHVAVEWMRLRSGTADWRDYVEFLNNHGDWPGLKLLRRAGEAAIERDDDPRLIVAYFETQPPQTGHGAVRLAYAYQKLGRSGSARDVITEAWLNLPFSEEGQSEAVRRFGDHLENLHEARLDNLLWEGMTEDAERMLQLVEPGYRALARVRIALRRMDTGVDVLLGEVPARLKDDPGLNFERFVWRARMDMPDRAVAAIDSASQSREALGRPEKWAPRRYAFAHRMMRQDRPNVAYRLAAVHHLTEGSDFARLEWLAGYLALRKLGDPGRAAHHFDRFKEKVDSPISLGRAGYWLGAAYEAAGKPQKARAAYRFGARYQNTFYGQLAAERIGAPTDPALVGGERFPHWRKSDISLDPVVRAAVLFHDSGRQPHAAWFLAHRAETLDRKGVAQLAGYARAIGAEFAAIKVAKQGVKQGDTVVDYLFPLTGIEGKSLPIPPEVAIAVARQESEFNDRAVSPKGAIGYMQLMPRTGRALAAELGLNGKIETILRDRDKNVLLGSTYMRERLEDYGGSYVMSLAAYNAGPNRMESWLPQIGDPRESSVDAIDWIEHLPFNETRNYVMRILEAITVYRMRMSGRPGKIHISELLGRG